MGGGKRMTYGSTRPILGGGKFVAAIKPNLAYSGGGKGNGSLAR